jgi:pyruvate/2-oxoglutarate/acetoin dehydrogenase E1 component
MVEMTYVDAIKSAIQQEMRADEKVFMVGQDIRGAIYPHSKGLVQEFGEDRIIDTPMSEFGMFGTGFGAALAGYRPIVDFMFGACTFAAGEQLLIQLGQQYFLHGSKTPVPLTIMGAAGTGKRLANDHAYIPRGELLHRPGLKYVFPSTPADAKGLMASAIRDNNPVFFYYHYDLLMDRGEVPEGEHYVPLGSADVKREGSDITILANGLMYKHAMQVADKLEGEISVEVVDPRSFEPFDLDTLMKSLEKTNHLVIVDEDHARCGFASEVMAQVFEHGFDLLDAPVERVCIDNVPIPGGYMEPTVVPTPEKVEAAVRRVLA